MAHVRDVSAQAAGEVGMVRMVLCRRPATDAVDEDGFQPVEIGTPHVGMRIDDNSSDLLPQMVANDPALGNIHAETFGPDDLRDERQKRRQASQELLVAGERQVVGVPRVARAKTSAQRC